VAGVIFGSGIVEQHVYNTLRVRAPIQAALGDPPRIKPISAVPPGMKLPVCLHYVEVGEYGGSLNSLEGPDAEELRYIVRFICQGESTDPVRAAAKDAFTALTDEFSIATVVQDGQSFQLSLDATNEYPITTLVEERDGVTFFYRQLGFYLAATVAAV
jgi:hypothetical protein